ncbi:glycosyltransferase family 2 protein [Lentzea sp. E54]|uniref:glycosyltransferase family 2 protein n=1 Tax=Lentzea xerophila TaxID=3435883 RepID=UPI003DA43544
MHASVVIPSYNARASLEACLNSLDRQRLSCHDKFDVVVVDDGSDDGTSDLLSSLPVERGIRHEFIPRTELSSRARARNRGVSAAGGDLVIFVDADQVLPPDFVGHHIRSHALHRDLVVIGPRHYLAKGDSGAAAVTRMAHGRDHPPIGERDHRERIWAALSENLNDIATCWHYMFTCNASVRREHLLEAGGFDENFLGWGLEDSELGYRLRKRGLLFAYNPRAATYHEYAADPSADLHYEEWRRNLTYFTSKHCGPDSAVQWILDRSFDLQHGDLKPLDAILRFEYAVRALDGRVPNPNKWLLIEITEANISSALEQLSGQIASGPCIVFDWTDDADLAIRVQTTKTSHDLLYFRTPDAPTRERLFARFDVSSG